MRTLVRRIRILWFLCCSVPRIVRESGGLMKFARRLVAMLRRGGPGHTAGELLTQAARLRRHDAGIDRRWRRLSRLAPVSHKTAPYPGSGCPILVVDTAYLAPLLAAMKAASGDFRIIALDHGNEAGVEVGNAIGNALGSSTGNKGQADPRVTFVASGEHQAVQELISTVGEHYVTLVAPGFLPDRGWFAAMAAAISGGCTAAYADYEKADGGCFFLPDFSPALLDYHGYLPALAVRVDVLVDWLATSAIWQTSAAIRVLASSGSNVTHLYKPLGRQTGNVPEPAPRPVTEKPAGLVSIIIPTRDNAALLEQCVTSIRRSSPDAGIELILLDNNSVEESTRELLAAQASLPNTRVIDAPIVFNWSVLNNLGARAANGETLVFLNNDVEVISPDWLTRLATLAAGEHVGAVGPLLLYDDRVVQHAGIVVGYGGFADHVYAGSTVEEAGDSCFIPADVTRNVAAVTGACLVTSRAAFDALGGFSEQLAVAGDLDYCLRALAAGYLNVFDGTTRLIHHESRTRAHGLPDQDKDYLRRLIGEVLPNGDPYYHPGLSLHSKFPLPDIFH